MDNEDKQLLKCKFCNYTVSKHIVTIENIHYFDGGQVKVHDSGWEKLRKHCMDWHKDEPAVQEFINDPVLGSIRYQETKAIVNHLFDGGNVEFNGQPIDSLTWEDVI